MQKRNNLKMLLTASAVAAMFCTVGVQATVDKRRPEQRHKPDCSGRKAQLG